MSRWKWDVLKAWMSSAADHEALARYLEDGWEPFAVTSDDHGDVVWLRIKVEI